MSEVLLQSVISRFIADRDEAHAEIERFLSGGISGTKKMAKAIQKMAEAERSIEIVQRLYAIEQNKKMLPTQEKNNKTSKNK